MDAALGSLLNFYSFSTGRRIFALQQVQKIASDTGFKELDAHITPALKHDAKTREIELQWSRIPVAAPRGQAETQRVDALTDRTLTAIRDTAMAQATSADPDDPIGTTVDTFLQEIFPLGVQDVTKMLYVDELSAVDAIVVKLKGKLAPQVVELGLSRLADRLAKLAVEYRAAMEAPESEALSFGTVRAARAQGQEYLLQAVALILGRYYRNTKADVAARQSLLSPILKQNDAIRQYLRVRRAVEDVNPETGQVDPAAPVVQESPGQGDPMGG
jgi:hypothetical protein